jgi:hypothetical protein
MGRDFLFVKYYGVDFECWILLGSRESYF